MVTVALEMHVMREECARRQPALASLRPRQPPARGSLPHLGLPQHPWVLPWGCRAPLGAPIRLPQSRGQWWWRVRIAPKSLKAPRQGICLFTSRSHELNVSHV